MRRLWRLVRQMRVIGYGIDRENQPRGRKSTMQRAIQRRCPKLVALATFLATAALGASLTGCSSLYSESATAGAGIAGAAVASTVTRNAAVASGIGLGALAAAKAGVQYSHRVIHTYSHNHIPSAPAPLPAAPAPP